MKKNSPEAAETAFSHELTSSLTSSPFSIEDMAVFCKKKGFVIQNSEIYGGMSGFFDYGPLGVEMKNNIKAQWWKYHVTQRDDIVGIDGCIIAHPDVWKASGHVNSFVDVLVECTKCRSRFRADQLIEDSLNSVNLNSVKNTKTNSKINVEGLKPSAMDELIEKHKISCSKCKGHLGKCHNFNLMFETFVGPADESKAYLRPETAQLIFANFKSVTDTSRVKLPFGIAQVGKAFRNEISPRNFIFRCREFEQMEIEYFVHPEKTEECQLIEHVMDYKLLVLSAEMQNPEMQNTEMQKKAAKPQAHKLVEATEMSIRHAIEKNIIRTKWHAYWLAMEHNWFVQLGLKPSHLRIRQHLDDEKSHYALDTWDLEYKFPFGWKELQGMANRTDFDLKQHMNESKKDLSIFDEETKKKIIPHVIAEPSQGVERAFLVFMFDAYKYDSARGNVVLSLHPMLAPVKAMVFPLLSNRPELIDIARKITAELKKKFNCSLDTGGSIGRRYARADEIGVCFCITVDFDSLRNHDVTIRSRDTTEQKRVKIDELSEVVTSLLEGKPFAEL